MSGRSVARSRHATVAAPAESGHALSGIHLADNLALMRTLPDAACDLIYVDPPFNVARIVGSPRRADLRFRGGHQDGLTAYLDDLRPRLVAMKRLLSDRGSLWVHLDWHTVHYVKVMLDETFSPAHFLNEIIWSYRSGGRPGAWFARKHDTILVYVATPGQHTFNVQRGGEYRTQDLKMTPDGVPYKSTTKGPLMFHPDGPALTDVWDLPFLSTVSKQRTGYPTQKPEALIDRIVRAGSNEGDLVADFYCGSGTTLAVAKRTGRRFLGCDHNPAAVRIARDRVDRIQPQST